LCVTQKIHGSVNRVVESCHERVASRRQPQRRRRKSGKQSPHCSPHSTIQFVVVAIFLFLLLLFTSRSAPSTHLLLFTPPLPCAIAAASPTLSADPYRPPLVSQPPTSPLASPSLISAIFDDYMPFLSWADFLLGHDGAEASSRGIHALAERFAHGSSPVADNALRGEEATLFLGIAPAGSPLLLHHLTDLCSTRKHPEPMLVALAGMKKATSVIRLTTDEKSIFFLPESNRLDH
jgi:hypothetical protein